MSTGDELLKGAGRLFRKVGGTVVNAGKQVTGIGLGTVRLSLTRTRFAPGDTINGSVVLALPEPVDGKRLVVGVRAWQRAAEQTVYKFERELGGAESYASGERAFELTVPP